MFTVADAAPITPLAIFFVASQRPFPKALTPDQAPLTKATVNDESAAAIPSFLYTFHAYTTP